MRLLVHYRTSDNYVVGVEVVNSDNYEDVLTLSDTTKSILCSESMLEDSDGNAIDATTFINNFSCFLVSANLVRQIEGTTLNNRIIAETDLDMSAPMAIERANTISDIGRI